ncbi:MAG: transposase [Clostridiales bacterium]|nr:transposase [Clostridiales bacterium]
MARRPREKNENGFYHVIARGIGKMIIFENDYDYTKMIELLFKYSDECKVKIIAYCLMDNHFHLLIKDDFDAISLFMKKTLVSYSYYFNEKYQRSGHLFQNRFVSRVVENEADLLNVFKYIMNNPVKACISSCEDYKWCNYVDFFIEAPKTHVKYIKDFFANEDAISEFILSPFPEEDNKPVVLKDRDKDAITITIRLLEIENVNDIRLFSREKRDNAIIKLKNHGLSNRQIERITGINRGVIQRIKGES